MTRGSVPFLSRWRRHLKTASGVALIVWAWSFPAFADDPFAMEPSSWVSFDRYKEKPENWVPPEARAQAAVEPVVVPAPTLPANMPIISAPTRPINTPSLPGVNGGFNINVSTTADDNHPLASINSQEPDLNIPSINWKDAFQFAHNKKEPNANDTEESNGPLDVRFTYLPSMIKSSPKPKKLAAESVVKKVETTEVKPSLPVTVAPPPSDPAACAAIDAYKKHQLEAIESDRRTLEALQAAIAELGLQKKLDFMSNAGGSLRIEGTGPANTTPPVVKN